MLKISHNAGFFSCSTIRLEKIVEYYNSNKKVPDVIDYSDQYKMYKPSNANNKAILNMWYAESDSHIKINYRGAPLRVTFTKDEQQFADYKQINYNGLASFVNKYFKPSGFILDIVKEYETKYGISGRDYENMCAVFYRSGDKHLETVIPAPVDFIEKAKEVHATNNLVRFVIVSEDQVFISEFKKEFPTTIVISESDNSNRFLHSVYFFAAVQLLSRMKHCICNSSNISFWIMLYRGNANNVHQYFSPKEYIYGVKNESYCQLVSNWL
jgi:hypothetical protein